MDWNRRTRDATEAPPARPAASEERYVRGEELGRGGMGRVFAATDLALDRQVAIKQALSDDPSLLAKFAREARLTAKLGHPAIVPVFDTGRDADGQPFYVMRRIDGEPLADRVARGERLALVPNVLAAIDAAAFAHAQRIVHRDIKPGNILVGAYGETLLIDWGLARELDGDDDATGQPYGTPGFQSPEQARGEAIDARGDVYALGATLRAVLGDAPPRELVAIVDKATAERAADRYPDAGALAADVRRFLAGQLVAAHAYTARERVWRFVRRHRVATLATLATIAIGAWAIANVIRERDVAERERQVAIDRADLLLLDRARSDATRDPARAIAALRALSPQSQRWRAARAIASIAAQQGVPSGSRDHTAAITGLAFAADGHRLASTSDDGTLRIRDLATGASRVLFHDVDVADPTWAGETIAVGTRDGRVEVDVATGAHRVRGATASEHRLVATSPNRVASVEDHAVVERDTAGVELHRLPVDADVVVRALAYGAHGLEILRSRGGRRAIIDLDGRTRFDGTFEAAWFATDGARDAIAGDDGIVRVLVDDTVELLPLGRPIREVAIAHDWVVAGSRDGTLYWWDLRVRLPDQLAARALSPCDLFGTFVVGTAEDAVAIADLDGGAIRAPFAGPMASCVPPVVDASVLISALDGPRLVELQTGKVQKLDAQAAVIDAPRDSVVTVRGRELHALHRGADRLIATLPAEIQFIAARGGVTYAQLADGTLRRIGGGQVAAKEVIDRMIVDAAGACWFTRNRTLLRWDGTGAVATIATLPDEIANLAPFADDGATAVTATGAVYVVGADRQPVQRLENAPSSFVRLSQRVAVMVRAEGTLVVDLETGAIGVHPGPALGAAISADGRRVAIGTSDRVRVYRDRVPSEPAPLRAWLAQATNATLVPGSDALQWPSP